MAASTLQIITSEQLRESNDLWFGLIDKNADAARTMIASITEQTDVLTDLLSNDNVLKSKAKT